MAIRWGQPGFTEPTLLPHLVESCPAPALVLLCRTATGFGYGGLGLAAWPPLAEVVLHAVAARSPVHELVRVGSEVPTLLAHTPADRSVDVAGAIVARLPDGGSDVDGLRRADLAARAAILDRAHLELARDADARLASWFRRESPRGLIAAAMGATEADRYVAEVQWGDVPLEHQVALLRAVGPAGRERIRAQMGPGSPSQRWTTWGPLYPSLDERSRRALTARGSELLVDEALPAWLRALVAIAVVPDLGDDERDLAAGTIVAGDPADDVWSAHLRAIVTDDLGRRVEDAHPPELAGAVADACRTDPAIVGELLGLMWDRWAGAPPARPSQDRGLGENWRGGVDAGVEADVEPAPEPPPGDRPAVARYVNVCFVRDRRGDPLPRTLSLATGRRYFLRIDIGDLDAASLVENPGRVPVEHLPTTQVGHWLRVAVVSDDVQVASAEQAVFLPLHGPAWVCDCAPGDDHVCVASQRERFVLVPVTTRPGPRTAALRIIVYHDANVVQSFAARVAVQDDEVVAPAATVRMDYSLTGDLSGLADLPPRDVSLLTESNGATHTLVVAGPDGGLVTATLGDGARANVTQAARQVLLAVHVERTESGGLRKRVEVRNRYGRDNEAPSVGRFRADLRLVAPVGRRAWDELLGSLQTTPDVAFALAGVAGTRIQVATPPTSRFGFPWALVYDIPLGTDPARFRDCPVLDEWDLGLPEPPAAAGGGCPHASSHAIDTICPFGFWGFRHVIEQPLPSPSGTVARRVGPSADAIAVVCTSSAGLLAAEAAAHIGNVKAMLGWPVSECRGRDDLSAALRHEGIAVSYFFCHGRWSQDAATNRPSTYLELTSDESIAAGDLMAWDQVFGLDHWKAQGPLVFLNGCHTADVTPESVADLVTGFARLGAAGVVGTETTVHQQVAAHVAEEFWRQLVGGGSSVGEAMRAVRRRLLARGNLMGLAYTAFCADELTLT